MNDTINDQLKYLGLKNLQQNRNAILKAAQKKQPSYHRFIEDIIAQEYAHKKENARLARVNKANIKEKWIMETFPWAKQTHLKKKLVMELYDSMRFVTEPQQLVFIGPTGCGKSGLATSFLMHAISQGYRGYFIDFKKLVRQLFQSRGDYSEDKIIKRYQSYDILLIDEIGYGNLEKKHSDLFFDLMRVRANKRTTLLTSQLGFEEWGSFMQNEHLAAALLDRITVACTIFNMKKCVSLRPKKIVHATKD